MKTINVKVCGQNVKLNVELEDIEFIDFSFCGIKVIEHFKLFNEELGFEYNLNRADAYCGVDLECGASEYFEVEESELTDEQIEDYKQGIIEADEEYIYETFEAVDEKVLIEWLSNEFILSKGMRTNESFYDMLDDLTEFVYDEEIVAA